MSPRIAWSAVLLPAPFGPTIPRMRPSRTSRSMPSRATVVPKDLRRPRASMQDMASALLLDDVRPPARRAATQELLGVDAEPPDVGSNPRPVLGEKLLTFALQELRSRALDDEHAAPAPGLDELLVHQFLVGLQHGDGIDPVLGGDGAHGGQGFALVQRAVEDHGDDPAAELTVDGL